MPRTTVPFADAAQAVVVAVLAVRHRVQVEEHRDSLTLSPDEGAVEVVDAAEVRLVIAEREVGDREPHRVDAATGQFGEVPLGDEGVAVRTKKSQCCPRSLSSVHIWASSSVEVPANCAGDPLLEHQLAAEVDPADHGRSPSPEPNAPVTDGRRSR
jgi:hypothetical protein